MDERTQVFVPLYEESKDKKYQEEVPVYVPKCMHSKNDVIGQPTRNWGKGNCIICQ